MTSISTVRTSVQFFQIHHKLLQFFAVVINNIFLIQFGDENGVIGQVKFCNWTKCLKNQPFDVNNAQFSRSAHECVKKDYFTHFSTVKAFPVPHWVSWLFQIIYGTSNTA